MDIRSSRRVFMSSLAGCMMLRAGQDHAIRLLGVPQGGLQPQAAVDANGVIHIVYLYGDPAAADIGYVRIRPDGGFSSPVRVNSQPGSAIAIGTVRGAHLAIGKSGSVHVAWNGSSTAEPKGKRGTSPMLYTRLVRSRTSVGVLDERGNGFEPQRNLMTFTSGLDGGGTVAADPRGNVYVTWHGQGEREGRPTEGEQNRRVWLAYSSDGGKTFAAERAISPENLGACACCGMGALADDEGKLYVMYRSAREMVHRDMYLLMSSDLGRTFRAVNVQPWEIGACPMSTVSLARGNGGVLLAWETDKQVYFTSVDARTGAVGNRVPAPGAGNNRKHPSIAVNERGELLLAWTEGTGWKKGGSLRCQLFDTKGEPLTGAAAEVRVPAWDFGAAVVRGRSFAVVS